MKKSNNMVIVVKVLTFLYVVQSVRIFMLQFNTIFKILFTKRTKLQTFIYWRILSNGFLLKILWEGNIWRWSNKKSTKPLFY